MSAPKTFTFSHEEEQFTGTIKSYAKHHSLTIDQLPNLVFKVDKDETGANAVQVLLPTDKKGGKPYIHTTLEETPILKDAIDAGLFAEH